MQEKPYWINSVGVHQTSYRIHIAEWGLTEGLLGKSQYEAKHSGYCATTPASQANWSPWWQLMRPALQATCQLCPSASWRRGTATAGCHCMNVPRNFHNVPTVCRKLCVNSQQVRSFEISAYDSRETTAFCNCAEAKTTAPGVSSPHDFWPQGGQGKWKEINAV